MITTSTVIDHRGRVKRTDLAPIEVRVTVNRKPYYINTGIKVYKKEFRQGLVINRPDSDILNERITLITRQVEQAINACLRDNKPINVAEIRNSLYGAASNTSNEFVEWLSERIEMLSLAEGTIKHYNSLHKRIVEYGCLRTWSNITVDGILRFDNWLHQLTKPQTQAQKLAKEPPQRISDVGVYNYHKVLKKMLYIAEKIGKIERNPYSLLKGEFRRGEREKIEYLTEHEMQKIENLHFQINSHLDTVRNLFVIQMYTGMAYADLMQFDINNYHQVHGKWMINQERVKTGVAFVGQLLPPVIRILERWNYQIPTISNQKYNEALKEIGEKAEIQTKLHSHLARHTFATYMLSNGVKVENLQRMMGHKDISMTQRYAKTLAQNVHDEFDMISAKMTKSKPESPD